MERGKVMREGGGNKREEVGVWAKIVKEWIVQEKVSVWVVIFQRMVNIPEGGLRSRPPVSKVRVFATNAV